VTPEGSTSPTLNHTHSRRIDWKRKGVREGTDGVALVICIHGVEKIGSGFVVWVLLF
jgi:hypothetical protein